MTASPEGARATGAESAAEAEAAEPDRPVEARLAGTPERLRGQVAPLGGFGLG